MKLLSAIVSITYSLFLTIVVLPIVALLFGILLVVDSKGAKAAFRASRSRYGI